MRNLIAFPVLGLAVMLQSTIVSQVQLFSGAADLMLLVVAAWALQPQVESGLHWALLAGFFLAFISAMPFFVPVASLLVTVALARVIQRRMVSARWVALLSLVILATLVSHGFAYIGLLIVGTPLALQDVVAFVTLPSMFANLLLCLPVHSLVHDLALWVYPQEDIV